jgi:hypothetical protein
MYLRYATDPGYFFVAHPEYSQGKRFVSSPKLPDGLWGPSSLIFNGYRGYFTGVKRLGQEVDSSPTSNVEVKNKWRYTSTPLRKCLHGVDRERYIFTNFPFSCY